MHLHVLDARQHLVPVGVPGELWIGGAGVSQGYVGRPELTRERFGMVQGARCYRTGDRVRRLPSGALEFLGRLDQQVKLRGYRVELGEIEAVLEQHPGVRQAAVVYRDGTLLAFVVRVTSAGASDASVRQLCAERLPDYMVPSVWVTVASLPLTANGKLDRKALASLAPPAATTEKDAFVAPRDEERVGIHDNFLDLGGHSLLAIRVLGKISGAFHVRLPLRALFDAPTVAQLAVAIRAAGDMPSAAPAITPRARQVDRTATKDTP
jgi:acyl carrier protein